MAMRSPIVLVVHPSLPVKSVKELIALAKARPGELNYGAGGSGASPHLAAETVQVHGGRQHRAHQLQRHRAPLIGCWAAKCS